MPRSDRTPLRRTWPQRLLITGNAVALVAALVTASVLAYSNDRLSEIERVDLSEVTDVEDLADGAPQNWLIVGVDDASDLAEGDPVRNRDATAGLHTDTIMVVRVDPRAASAQLVSFPRDLWLPIADTDSNQRINSALDTGGPRRLIKTIDENFAIPIHHYVEIDFADFRTLTELVDGIPVQFPRPARAESSGLVIDEPGCYTLGPEQALGFSRARKDYEVQDDDGEWQTDLGGDYSRVERQQLFVQLALRRAITKGARNPNTLRQLVDVGVGTVRVDDALRPEGLVGLARRFRSFDPEELVTYTLPTVEDTVGGADVLFLREEEAEPTLAVFRGVGSGGGGGVSPSDVVVQVLNGTSVEGQAGDVTDELTDAGFEALVPDDSDEGGLTTVRYLAGAESMAQLVARYLQGPVRYEPALDLGGADVALVTGSDWEGVASRVRPADEVSGPTTTTTEPPSTGSTSGDGSSTTASPGGEVDEPEGDPDDPDDPLFYRAEVPPPGADCPRTG